MVPRARSVRHQNARSTESVLGSASDASEISSRHTRRDAAGGARNTVRFARGWRSEAAGQRGHARRSLEATEKRSAWQNLSRIRLRDGAERRAPQRRERMTRSAARQSDASRRVGGGNAGLLQRHDGPRVKRGRLPFLLRPQARGREDERPRPRHALLSHRRCDEACGGGRCRGGWRIGSWHGQEMAWYVHLTHAHRVLDGRDGRRNGAFF